MVICDRLNVHLRDAVWDETVVVLNSVLHPASETVSKQAAFRVFPACGVIHAQNVKRVCVNDLFCSSNRLV